MDSKANNQDPILRLFEAEIEPVYRYHLARCENHLEAQDRVVLTYQTAIKWIHTCPLTAGDFNTWIMEIARYQQSFGRRRATAKKSQSPAPVQDAGRIPVSFDGLAPEQGEIWLRDRISRLSSTWQRLPRGQSDALALHYFGSLSLSEVGAVLGKNETEAAALVSREASFASELLEIASSVHPPQELVELIGSRIHESRVPPARQAGLSEQLVYGIKADIWKLAFRLRHTLAAGSRVVQLGLLLGVLAGGFYIIQRQSIIPPLAQSTPTPAIVPTPALQIAAASLIPDAMAPPDPATCLTWQTNLANLVASTFTLTNSISFTDPTSANSAVSGTGCELEATLNGNTQTNAFKTVTNISQMFSNAGYFQSTGFEQLPGNPPNAFFPPYCPGFGRSFQKDDLYVFLSASYCPAAASQPSPIPGAPGASGGRGYTLRLILSSNTVQTQLNRFLSLWSTGNKTALGSLSPALRRKYLNIRDLDQMAGLNRSPSRTIRFTWQPVQNSGDSLRIEVQTIVTDSQNSPGNPQPTFQMVLTQDKVQWSVSNATKTVLFSSTEDSVILADTQGQVLQLSLANGLATPLSGPGFYLPQAGSPSHFSSQVSPDGQWLALVQPGSGLQPGTWLIGLNGQPARHLNSHELNLTWSPDSQKIAFFDPVDPQILKMSSLATGATESLVQFSGIPVSLAWSPTGDMIGITFVEARLIFNPSGSAGTSTFVNVGLVPLATRKLQVLAQFAADMRTLSPGDLSWTSDGEDLWYGPGKAAFQVSDGSVHPLTAQPLAGELANQQANLLRFSQPGQLLNQSPAALLSPDWQTLAEVYSTTNSTNDYLAILPAAETASGASAKNQCCLEYLGGIAAFAWTGDGKGLVVYNGINGPGNLLLVNPTSGERQTAATGVYYIGLLSSLKQAGLKLAPEVKVSRSPYTDLYQTWPKVDNSISSLHLQVPSGWNVWQPGKDYTQGAVVVANFNFDNPFGFASLNPGDLYFSISKIPMSFGQTTAGWYSQMEAINQPGQLYEAVTIDGIRGFHRVMDSNLVPKDEYMLPVGESIIVIEKYPLISDYNLVFKQILASITFQ